MKLIKQVMAIVERDIVSELRTKDMLYAMLVFIILAFVVLRFGLDSVLKDPTLSRSFSYIWAGLLWIAFVFAALLGLNRTFIHEKDEGSMDGLLLAPIDRSVIYIGKFISNIVFLVVIQIFSVPIFAIWFVEKNFLSKVWYFAIILILGDLGLVAVGTLLSAISVNTRARDLMLPIIFIPIIIPLLAFVVGLTRYVFVPGFGTEVSSGVQFLVVYDIIFLTIPFLVFDFVVED